MGVSSWSERMRGALAAALIALAAPAAARAQSALTAPCASEFLPDGARATCYAVAQTAESLQPQLGVLVAGGNPTLGAASTQGLRFGRVPRISASLKLNASFVRVPDIVAAGSSGAAPVGTFDAVAPALAGALSVGVLPGFTLAPGFAGLGSVDLLGSATWLPFRAFDIEGLRGSDVGYGLGARFGILRESFSVPGVSVSVMRHHLPRLGFGEPCDPEHLAADDPRCDAPSSAGALAADLTNWSTRAVASKRLVGFGLTGGIGYDHYASDLAYAFRHDGQSFASGDVRLKQDRWSAFGNLSYTLLIATLGLEAGWQQGSGAVPGYDAASSSFDPKRGHWFGSAGVRLHF
jgi:hypothetical protein